MSEQPRFKDFLFERADEAKVRGRLHKQIEYLVEHSEAVTEYLDAYGAPRQQKDAVGDLAKEWKALAREAIDCIYSSELLVKLETCFEELEAREAGR